MAAAEFTTKDVRQFITSILLVGSILKVDDQGAVYWKGGDADEPVVLELAGGGKGPVFTYTTSANKPDAIIVNPFAESNTLSADRKWFYKVTSTIFSGSLIRAMDSLLRLALSEAECPYPELVPYLTPVVGKVDEKLLQEFKYISEVGANDFCTIAYHTKNKETRLFLGIEDPTGDFQKSIPTNKVRKRSWETLQNLLKSIFKTAGPVAEELKNSTPLIACPQFRTYMDVWLRCWKAIAPILTVTEADEHEDLPVLLTTIEEHLDRVDAYMKLCQWLAPTVGATASQVKSAVKKLDVPGAPVITLPQQQVQPQQTCCHSHPGPDAAPVAVPTYPGQDHGHPVPPSGSRWNTPQQNYPVYNGQPQPMMQPVAQPQYMPQPMVQPAGPGSHWDSSRRGYQTMPMTPAPQPMVTRAPFGDSYYNQLYGRPPMSGGGFPQPMARTNPWNL